MNSTKNVVKKMTRLIRVSNKIYDLGTSNKSFLKVAKDLKKLGIKNCYFMLELHDVSLIHVDPYACDKEGHTTLTQDQIARIIDECAINPWYYLREICRIPDPGGTAVPYIANRGNIAQAWCIWKGLDSWLCLPRQQGKTESAIAFLTWVYSFGTTNSTFIFINKDGENAKTNLRRMVKQIELLPEYLRFESVLDEETGKRVKGQKTATIMSNPHINNNRIVVKSKATSYDNALSLARGLTAPLLHFDEPEFTNHIGTIVSNSVSTYETAASRAKENGGMYGRIFTCTPGDLDTNAGKEAQEILKNCAKWTEKLYNLSEKEIQEYLVEQGKDCNGIFYIEYQYNQIGKNEEWLAKISAKIGDPLVVRREILLQRLHGSSLSPFSQEDIQYINEMREDPIDELWLLEYYKFDIYEKLNPRIPYIVGIDCASGTNGDNNAITVINPYTLRPVAEFECSYIGETKYEKLIINLVREHIPRAIVCIERNNVGDGIIDHLLNSSIASRLYYDRAKDLVDDTMKSHETIESMLKKSANEKTYYGVWTGPNSREEMFKILSRHVYEYKDNFVTHNIIRDIGGLIRKSSGRIEAGPGSNNNNLLCA